MEWSYENDAISKTADIDLAESAEPEWVQAGNFQLPLDLRRQLALRERGMSAQDQERREKLRTKRQARTERNKAKAQLTAEEKEQVRSSLMSKTRFEAMQTIVPKASAKRKAKAAPKKKVKTVEQRQLKNQYKRSLQKAQANFLKNRKDEMHEAPPLPPPIEEPKDEVQPVEEEERPSATKDLEKSLKMRVVRDQAGLSHYGRQGLVMGQDNEKYQLLFEADSRNKKEQLAWVRKDCVMRFDEAWVKKAWVWPQLTMSRNVKQFF